MREIKFRAWRPKTKEMDYRFLGRCDLDNCLNRRGVFSDWEIMQYTGLKTKSGVEIWEGDLVNDDEGVVRLIKWENGSFWAREFLVGHLASMIDEKIMSAPEVIGNIYENPELLEK